MIEFTEKDKQLFKAKGISEEKVLKQIGIFEEGIPFVQLEKAAVIDDGILSLEQEQQEQMQAYFREHKKGLQVLKFTPASGAASRMFKDLFNFLEEYDPDKTALEKYLKKTANKGIKTFIKGMEKFAFYEMVNSRIGTEHKTEGHRVFRFVDELMSETGLNYGFYPKGLLPFHNYKGYLATPYEEHLLEGASYARSTNVAYLHFTISEDHQKLFDQEHLRVAETVEDRTKCGFHVDYSFQKGATDTIAVTPENEPFRTEEGEILFRPGGHGALIENLDEQQADLIFIKNIDNVVIRESLEEVAYWKEVLGGYLLMLQKQAFSFARMLEQGSLDTDLLNRIREFLETRLNARFGSSFEGYSIEEQLAVLKDKLFRPIRVCGMVRNEGEPGGGPFWVADQKGHISLQIVESAQVNTDDPEQMQIFKESTHFNPVDIVCGVRDAFGKDYKLMNFVDERLGFITDKTFEGRSLKALELPGLWNGAMAYWNTVFVEVPVSTFNPVKTVNDLLKPAHQV
ncbi:DUF4301 family protein [Robiginitalea sp. IMCC44478]|uniref:DUF4301 family protein n=1 Tax=Robiginitalea sp. IMCC44478 TaxID=3459122 RepID=UPI0040419826